MTSQGNTAYLEAMGITVWVERGVTNIQAAAASEISRQLHFVMCSDADSPWLWVIADARLESKRILADIRRAAGEQGNGNICYAVSSGGQSLEAMLDERPITRIVLFGQELDTADPVRQKNCDIVEAPALEELAGSVAMKKQLWNNLQQLLDPRQS